MVYRLSRRLDPSDDPDDRRIGFLPAVHSLWKFLDQRTRCYRSSRP